MPLGFLSTLFGNVQQQSHDIYMYDKQRRDYLRDREYSELYNSPAAQRQRIEAGGYNASLAMQNIQTGSVSGSTNPTASPSQMANTGAQLTQGVLSLIGFKNQQQLLESQSRNIAADAKLKEIEAYTAARENLARIEKLEGEGRESWKRGDHIDSDMTARYNKMMSEIGVNASQNEINWAIHATKMKELKYLPIDKALSWVETIGSILESASRQEVNKRQAEYLIEKATAERFGWKGKKFENELNEEARKWLLRGIKLRGTPSNFQQGIMESALEAGDGINNLLGIW